MSQLISGRWTFLIKLKTMCMNNKLFIIVIILISSASCKKDNNPATPVALPTASFAVIGDTVSNVITIGTYDQYQLINNSTNANSYLWNFGNDSTSNKETPVLSYPKSGSYVLTLTVQNATVQKSTVTKKVKVLDRVVKQVIITGLAQLINYPLSLTSQSFKNSNVWVELKLTTNNIVYPYPTGSTVVNTSFNAPIIYQSTVVSNFDSTKVPYTINVTSKIILDYPSVMLWNFNPQSANKNFGYGLELYAQKINETYLLSSSYEGFYQAQSGLGVQIKKADIRNNIFIIGYGNVEVICDYE